MSEAKKKMTEEEILKSLDAIIEETMGKDDEVTPASTEAVAKSEESKNENKEANGGEDKIKSGTPMSEEQAMKAKAKKEKEDKEAKDKAEKEKEEAEKSAQAEADLKKSADKDADDKKGAKEKEDKDADDKKKDGKKKLPAFMKKSIAELAEVLDTDELELVKAWREENDEAATEESSADIAKSVAQAIGAQLEDIKKSFDQKLSEKDGMIKSLSAEVKKLASQPAHGRQSVDSLETIEKSNSSDVVISKAQILDTMLELQKAGKGINSRHIAEFEATKNISNQQVKTLVMDETKKRFSN